MQSTSEIDNKALPELVPPQLARDRLAAQIAALPADTRPGSPTTHQYDALLKSTPAVS
ncbi:hypothetical protein [Salinispora arenicola]|uniref:hypothetical protein n=1 Tax=Salinispora arenicola TaxID=168697 RepID=UPI000379EE59|nr:hypothetical protein [Salinispora arenicola]